MIEIPLSSTPEQLFKITLFGVIYDIRVLINSRLGVWTISFSSGGVDIVNGVSLVGGVDILKQYTLPIKNIIIVNLDNTRLDPSRDNLGTGSRLFILSDEELSSG